ncbi:MAG: hypothetical protein IKQ49_00100 [Eubacterium sp.]|nr:hypothetical protein [Eubacterium sp.]
MKNKDIRMMLEGSGVKYWELAEACGHRPTWLSMKLRQELPEDEKLKMIFLIQQIAEQKEVEA